MHKVPPSISLGDIQNVPTRSKFAIFQGFLTFWSNALKFRPIGGGSMCILFEICEKRPFQKCMGWGGGGRWSQFCTKSCKRKDTQSAFRCLVSRTLRHATASLYPDFIQAKPEWASRFSGSGVLPKSNHFILSSLTKTGGVSLFIPKLGCKSSGLRSGKNLVLLVVACRLL